MSEPAPNDLVILGIGNDSRGDDGLGWAFLDALDGDPEVQARLIYRYQLMPEDAAEIAQARAAIFVDATKQSLDKGFHWQPVAPERQPMVNSHWLPPEAVTGFCLEMQGHCPQAFVLSISGEQWELGQGLSDPARRRLEEALHFFRSWIRQSQF